MGAEKDHIVPWEAAWRINQLVKGDVRYVLASSGHIAGIINPPGGTRDLLDQRVRSVQQLRRRSGAGATAHDGSWWKDWTAWLGKHSGRKGKPPGMGSENYPIVEDAPGSYVLEK